MTEAEWLEGDRLLAKLNGLGDRYSFRKARLFAVACGRSGVLGGKPAMQRLLSFLERIADDPDQVERNELIEALRLVSDVVPFAWLDREQFAARAVDWALRAPPHQLMSDAATICAQAEGWLVGNPMRTTNPVDAVEVQEAAMREYVVYLHDIAGNPCRPVPWDPAWRAADTVGVARAAYEERAFDRLLLLADALMDAGCDDQQVIDHCRSDGPHVRGCWVVDWVLGKA